MSGKSRFSFPLAAVPPYVWLLLFFAVPLAIVLKISVAAPVLGQPPYTPLIENGEWLIQWDNYLLLLDDPLYIAALLNSLKIAAISTLITLLIGYPMAYAIARAKESTRGILMMLVILPFWTSFLIRVYAWMSILSTTGLLNNFLIWLGVINEPLDILYTTFAINLGIVYSYLPFMVLPLVATLSRMDLTLLEAAADLGAKPWQAFLRVTLPLSLPGILAGSLLVFIPATGEFVIPDLLGGPEALMIGKVMWTEFFSNRDWPVASALTVALLILLVGPMVALQSARKREAAQEAAAQADGGAA
ncbi:MAG TPA: ABC transporter permease subunit [Alphaproteobacteria bacterium]|nr:ABC transporter permease subunit [Alphaproteobacteria bacterium]